MKFDLGPYAFVASGSVSGYAPTKLDGPNRQAYVVEHQVPAREGGVTEYIGSQQSRYSLKGFVSPPQDGPFNGTAAAVLSGKAYVAVNADDAKSFLVSLRGSGAQLLRIESTSSNQSGYMNLYENGFFYIEKTTFGFEAGRTYPYYPYGIDLRGASTATFGNSSGTSAYSGIAGGYLSGYTVFWTQASGFANKNALVIAVGVNVLSVASGNMRVGVYSGNGSNLSLIAQSASQAVHSGWNYFPLRPSFTVSSGVAHTLGFVSDQTSQSGFTIGYTDSVGSGLSYQSGFGWGQNAMPAGVPGTFANVSGAAPDLVLVTV